MQSISNDNFGPLIAYLVPGVTVLVGLSQHSDTLQSWFATQPSEVPTIGGFLYLTVFSIAAGMTVSAIRWAVVDSLHRYTGLVPSSLDFSRLNANVAAFGLLIEIHYRHYQFYANMFVATAIAYGCFRLKNPALPPGWLDTAFVLLECIFFATSRDTLTKYFRRSEQLLGEQSQASTGKPTCTTEALFPKPPQTSEVSSPESHTPFEAE